MDTDGAEPKASTAVTPAPAVVEGEYRVIHPWRLWRWCRNSWWALGPYLGYCTALWGLAALAAWLMDRGRAG